MSMKFKIMSSKLAGALRVVQGITAGKSAVQIIQNVMIEAKDGQLSLLTTDLEISIRTTVPCEVEMPGSSTLPVKQLVDIIAKLDEGPVDIDVDENDRAVIKSGRFIARISGLSVEDFPPLPPESDKFEYKIPQMVFGAMLRKTAYAASKDETRRTLRGVLLAFKEGKLTAVATDGRRLAIIDHEMEFPQDCEQEIILPPKVVSELLKSLNGDGEARIQAANNRIVVKLGDTTIWSKLMADVYPNYKIVIPKNLLDPIVVDRTLFLKTLERVKVLVTGDTSSVRFTFADEELTISSNIRSSEAGESKESFPVKYSGEPLKISFKPDYITDVLRNIDDDEIKFSIAENFQSATITCSIPFLYVVMALREE